MLGLSLIEEIIYNEREVGQEPSLTSGGARRVGLQKWKVGVSLREHVSSNCSHDEESCFSVGPRRVRRLTFQLRKHLRSN